MTRAHEHIPRIIVSGVSSGVGKTTVAAALIGAFRARGLKVAAFKCGPDYLDPTYHTRASGGPCQNLDGWMMGREAVLNTFRRSCLGADIAVIEGVMGLFDGASPTSDEGSTAEIAKWLSAPVLVVVDAGGMARTAAAVARGMVEFDPALNVAGLICNQIGGRGHLDLLKKALSQPAILGGLPKRIEFSFPERHLGLRTASLDAVPTAVLDAWANLAAEWFDLDAIMNLAGSVPAPDAVRETVTAQAPPTRCRIGLAFDDAFHFYYEDNLARLESLGATLVRFSPIADAALPEPGIDGLYLGGGYPEVFAAQLSANGPMLDAIRRFAHAGGPVYAECGGLMYLAESIRTLDGQRFPMAGLIPIETAMCPALQAIGYVEVETREASILGAKGAKFRGHQFRYSEARATAETKELAEIYSVTRRYDGVAMVEGYRNRNVVASYVHAHWASNPEIPAAFVASCVATNCMIE